MVERIHIETKEQGLMVSDKLVEIIDKLLSSADWDATLYLRSAKKKLTSLRDEAHKLHAELENHNLAASDSKHMHVLAEGYAKVYVALYQAAGYNLQIWQSMLRSMVKHSVSRPIYTNEEHVRELIRTKKDRSKHAYAVVAVHQEDIVCPVRVNKDPLGHELVALTDDAIEPENIMEFVHANDNYYDYSDGLLTPIEK